MGRVSFITYGGKEILFLDFSNISVDELLKAVEEAKRVVAARPANSLLTLTDVTNARFNEEVNQKMKDFTAHNKPYVRAAAVVGITGLKKIIFDAVMLFSQRKLHSFETIEEA